ncbi:ABC transporter ATP-binding protein [Candidatus Gottesmanbacteria bacterium]|nr:ABC transporter ATP-binding protein [Candidatus Gottesmanbacteria bacterium]
MTLLSVKDLHVYYGESHILHGINFLLNEGEFIGVIGRNGVGKTTFIKSIIGLLKVRNGSIVFNDREISNQPPYEISRLGISYVPQGREIFPALTVLENLKVALLSRKAEERRYSFDLVFDFFPILKARVNQKGGTLSGGEQQMLAIGRALLASPKLLLLDEPTEGIQPSIVRDIEDRLKTINQKLGLAIILVEQNLELTFRLVNRSYLMEKGHIIKEGTSNELKDDDLIKKHLAI